MAKKVQVQLIDDLDGSEAVESVQFGLDGVAYTIDLCEKHVTELRDSLAKFVASARRVPSRTTRRTTTRNVVDRQRSALIRDWAREQGMAVSERGRIPASIAQKYDASH